MKRRRVSFGEVGWFLVLFAASYAFALIGYWTGANEPVIEIAP